MAQKFTVPVTIKNLSSAGSDGLTVFLDQESFARLKVEAGGRITWGAGSGAGDTNLYRDAESVLKTDDTFKAAGLYVAGTQIDPTGATVGDALIFNGTKFVSASVADGGATLTVSDTAPEDPSLGDLWFNSTDLEIYVYYSSSWIQVTDSSSGVQELYELVDVLIDDPVSGETLVYNGTEWVNEIAPAGLALSLETARAISISGDASGSVLFDGSQDVNITASVRFISGTEIDPSGATIGDALVFNGTKFVSASVAGGGGASLTVSDTPPPGASEGDLWFRSDTANTYVYYDSSWVEIGASGGVATLDDIGNVSASAPASGDFLKWNGSAWVNDSIDLGSETNGIYVADLVAGTGVTITNGASESASPTIAIGQSVGTTASVTFSNVTADLIGNVTGNLTGDVTGNADTATSLETSRIIALSGDVSGSVSFDGSASVSIATTIQPNSVALGADTTGNYMSDITQGTGVTITHTPGEGSSATIAIGQSVATSASVTFANVSSNLVGNVTGNLTGDVTGNSDTATALETARTISISGDVSGSVSFDGTGDVSITATVQPDSVVLGTDTTGNYVNDLTGGTGVIITHTPGEGSNPTVAIGQSVATSASVSFAQLGTSGDLTVGGNLTVNGTTTTLNTETLSIEDNIIVLNNGVTGSPTINAGIEVERGTSPNVAIRWNETSDKWEFTDDGSTYYDIASEDFVTSLAVSTLDDLSNVSASAPADGEFLKYVSASSVWVPASIPTINALDDIGDVSASVASPGQFLKWNGTAWVPETIIGGATISDSAPAGPLAGQLWFDSTVGKTFVYYDSQWIEVGGVGTGARMVSSSSAPASPLEGSMWFDTDTAQTFVYYDSSWIEIGASGVTASVQDSAPASPVSGQIWFNSLTGGTYVYYGTNWIEVGASPFSALVNTINAKGDLLVGTADNTIGGLTAGSAGQVLTVDSSTATGLKWDTPVSTGKAIAMSIVFGS